MLASVAPAAADGHCQRISAAADAEAAIATAPSLFARGGYLPQQEPGEALATSQLRVSGGVAMRLAGVFEGRARRAAAAAECSRHASELSVDALPRFKELEARVRVLAEAGDEAAAIAAEAARETAEHVGTTSDLLALRLRLDRLEALRAEAQDALAGFPTTPPALTTLASLAASEHAAESAVQTVRTFDALRFDVRAGYERFTEPENRGTWFVVVDIEVPLGALAVGGVKEDAHRAIDHAAATRDRLVTAQIASDSERAARAAERIVELSAQLHALDRAGGPDARRQRRLVWCSLVEQRALHAGATAALVARRAMRGETR